MVGYVNFKLGNGEVLYQNWNFLTKVWYGELGLMGQSEMLCPLFVGLE